MADPDQHREVVIATLRMMTASIAGQLRNLAKAASTVPGLTPEQALNDAALAVEKSLAVMLAKLGSKSDPKRRH